MTKSRPNKLTLKGKVMEVYQEEMGTVIQVICKPDFIIISSVQDDSFHLYDDVVIEGDFRVKKIGKDLGISESKPETT